MNKKISGLIIWFISTLFVVYAFFLNTAAAVYVEAIKTALHFSTMGAVFAVCAFILGFICMQMPAGYLLDRFPIQFVTSGGVLLLVLGNVILTFASNLPLFVLSNFIQGLGASFAFVAVGKLISEWFAPKLFPILFGLTQTLSCVLTALVHCYLVNTLGVVSWQKIYMGFALFGLAVLILVYLFVRSPSRLKPEPHLSFKRSLREVFRNKQIVLYSLAGATSFGVLSAYASFWDMPVEKYFWTSSSNALTLTGAILVGAGIGAPFFGWLSNQLRSRNFALHISVVLGAIFTIMGLYLPHLNMMSFSSIKLFSFLAGFFLSGAMLYYTCISETCSDHTRAVSLSLINTCVFIFNTLLLFIPQMMISKTAPTYFTSVWIFPACLLISLFLAYFTNETYGAKKR